MSANNSNKIEYQNFWLDGLAGKLGFRWIADQLPGSLPPSYVYAVFAVVVPEISFIIYNQQLDLTLGYVHNPYMILEPVILIGAVIAARQLQRDYDRVMDEMDIRNRAPSPNNILAPVPSWLPWLLFILGVAVLFVFPGAVHRWERLTTYVDNFFVLPFVYTPIVVQFFTTYLTIEFLGPWKLSKSDDIGIHFFDPEGVGGLRPLGELVKKAYYFVVIGLIGYALIMYEPFVDAGPSIASTSSGDILFTVIWLSTISTVVFAVLTLHRWMHREKRKEICRLEKELHEYVDDPYDIEQRPVPDDKKEHVKDLKERIARINSTSEYPATFNIWSQLLISIALPKLIQLFISNV